MSGGGPGRFRIGREFYREPRVEGVSGTTLQKCRFPAAERRREKETERGIVKRTYPLQGLHGAETKEAGGKGIRGKMGFYDASYPPRPVLSATPGPFPAGKSSVRQGRVFATATRAREERMYTTTTPVSGEKREDGRREASRFSRCSSGARTGVCTECGRPSANP